MYIIAKKRWHIQQIWHFWMYHVIQKTCSINHWKMNGCYGCKHQITENKITLLMIQISSIFLPNTWHILSYNISDFYRQNKQCNAIGRLFKFDHSVCPFTLILSLFSLGLPQQVVHTCALVLLQCDSENQMSILGTN